MKPGAVKAAVSAAALGLLALGIAFVFAGAELADALGWSGGEPMASLLGGALVGLGAANWMVRSSPMGGIYGRAVVLGTQVHFVVGAAALLRLVSRTPASAGALAVTAFYVLGAALYAYLLFARGVRRPAS
ncbi:MAG: hypothetical protein ABW221_01495 [Vicinamibacteria bacterium]